MIENELKPKVSKWLTTQGFPFEMAVEREFKINEFSTSISDYYQDPVTNKLRETDVTARTMGDFAQTYVSSTVYSIECKYSKKTPWVLFSREKDGKESAPFFRFFNSNASKHLVKLMNRDKYFRDKLIEHPFYSTRRIGYGIVQSLKSKEEKDSDIAYKACVGAYNASNYHVENANKYEKLDDAMMFANINIPLVVFDGCLFESFLNENNELNVEEIPHGVLEWKQGAIESVSKYIYIITKGGLADFIIMAKGFAKIFDEATIKFQDKLTKIVESEALKNEN